MKQRLPESLAAQQLRNEKGASMVEYALLASLIAVAAIGSVAGIGRETSRTLNVPGDTIKQVIGAGGILDPDEDPDAPCTRNCG